MKHLLWVVGLIFLVPGLWYLNLFLKSAEDQNTHYLVYSGCFLVVALVCFAIFVFKRFREAGEQDISITKF